MFWFGFFDFVCFGLFCFSEIGPDLKDPHRHSGKGTGPLRAGAQRRGPAGHSAGPATSVSIQKSGVGGGAWERGACPGGPWRGTCKDILKEEAEQERTDLRVNIVFMYSPKSPRVSDLHFGSTRPSANLSRPAARASFVGSLGVPIPRRTDPEVSGKGGRWRVTLRLSVK